jgi:hypothetical protein
MKDFIPYQQALALKELGFDEPCFGIWMERGNKHDVMYVAKQEDAWMAEQNDGILAPLYQQAFRWFREKYGLVIVIKPISDIKLELGYNLTKNGLIMKACTTYEEAELACLNRLIEIVKTNQP